MQSTTIGSEDNSLPSAYHSLLTNAFRFVSSDQKSFMVQSTLHHTLTVKSFEQHGHAEAEEGHDRDRDYRTDV